MSWEQLKKHTCSELVRTTTAIREPSHLALRTPRPTSERPDTWEAEAFPGEWKERVMAYLWGWDPSTFKVFAGCPKPHGSNLGTRWLISSLLLFFASSPLPFGSLSKSYYENLLGLAWKLLTEGLILLSEQKQWSFSGCVSVRFTDRHTEWCSSRQQLEKSPSCAKALIVHLYVLDRVVMPLLESWNPCFFLLMHQINVLAHSIRVS